MALANTDNRTQRNTETNKATQTLGHKKHTDKQSKTDIRTQSNTRTNKATQTIGSKETHRKTKQHIH